MKRILLTLACMAAALSVHADLVFKNTAIKVVDGKYRYFFHVANTGEEAWSGDVVIGYKAEAITMPRIVKKTLTIQPDEGSAFYADWTVAPDKWDVHGDYGIKMWIANYDSRKVGFKVLKPARL